MQNEDQDSRLPLVMHARVVSQTGGGPEKTILNSPRFLVKYGFRGVCVYLRHPGDEGFKTIENRAAAANAPLVPVDDFGIFDHRILGRVQHVIRDLKPTLWHGHDYKSNLIGLMLRKRNPMRLITTVHGWVQHTWKTPLYYAIDKWCLRRYEMVVCVSDDLYRDCQRLGVPDSRLRLIQNAIDTDEYKRSLTIEQAKDAIGWPRERLLVGAVGRLSAEKGFDQLIDAVDRLIKSGMNVGLVIAGDGGERNRLEELIRSRNIEDRVLLLGFCADPKTLYQAMDVYALSSIREGLPNVLLEAMSFGVPVVSTRVAGVPKLITDGVDGCLVEIGDVEQLSESLKTLLEAPSRRSELGANGRRTIEERFSFDLRIRRMTDLYRETFFGGRQRREAEVGQR